MIDADNIHILFIRAFNEIFIIEDQLYFYLFYFFNF